METFSSTPIDFTVRPAHGLAKGCVMQLSPGPEPASFEEYGGVYVSEDAFGIVEPIIRRAWPPYRECGHYGVTETPAGAWRMIVDEMRTLSSDLRAGVAPESLEWLGFNSDEVARQFRDRPASRHELANMLDELSRWVDDTLKATDMITIFGI